MNPFQEVVGKSISDAFKKLLSEKHLYQYVEPDVTAVPKAADLVRKKLTKPVPMAGAAVGAVHPKAEEVIPMGLQLYNRTWIPLHAAFTPSPTITASGGQQYVQFEIPPVEAYCNVCEGKWPCNPTSDCVCLGEGQDQWFFSVTSARSAAALPCALR